MKNYLCRVCGGGTEFAGRKFGKFSRQWYELRHCPACRFSFVANPWTDFSAIYSRDYYRGKGADPLVDYEFETNYPDQTIRLYEWQGLLRLVSELIPINQNIRWLDFGCGNGGLVRYVQQHSTCDAIGFDEGYAAEQLIKTGVPSISREELKEMEECFDIITAVEVLEHVINPVDTVQWISRLLRPGGIFFLTTGNAKPFRGRLQRWSYVVPEVHVSFFEPETLAWMMEKAGLKSEFPGRLPGFEKVIRFKVLKTLRMRRRFFGEHLLPIELFVPLIDFHFGISKHPIARK